MTLFENKSHGAEFSECRRYRYALWRIWDEAKPPVMFIGLNPSTANETANDPTIRRVIHFAKTWDHGGVYMLNCFPFVSTDPNGTAVGGRFNAANRVLWAGLPLLKPLVNAGLTISPNIYLHRSDG